METIVDGAGRIVVPRPLLDALGLTAGSAVDVSIDRSGLRVIPAGRTARIVERDGILAAESDTPVTDDIVFGLFNSQRR